MAIVKIRYKMLQEIRYHGETNTRYTGYWLMTDSHKEEYECLINTDHIMQLHKFKRASGDYYGENESGFVLRLFNSDEVKLVKEYVFCFDAEGTDLWEPLNTYTDLFINALDYKGIKNFLDT